MRFFIKGYIDKIELTDIIRFGSENGITVDKNEANILYYYLKNNWEDLLYGDPLPIIQEIEDKFDKKKCQNITNLFYVYKEKYKNYL